MDRMPVPATSTGDSSSPPAGEIPVLAPALPSGHPFGAMDQVLKGWELFADLRPITHSLPNEATVTDVRAKGSATPGLPAGQNDRSDLFGRQIRRTWADVLNDSPIELALDGLPTLPDGL
jgi:hypothetical protein